jgi:hypothetical protein
MNAIIEPMPMSGFTPELVASIIKRLSDEDELDDIILDVCQITGLPWAEAEARIRLVEEENETRITKKQFPLLAGIAFSIFAAGLVLTGYGVYGIITAVLANQGELVPRDITSYIMPVIERGIDPATAVRPAIFPYANLLLGFFLSPFSGLFFGISMIFGSLLGMKNIWSVLLNGSADQRQKSDNSRSN